MKIYIRDEVIEWNISGADPPAILLVMDEGEDGMIRHDKVGKHLLMVAKHIHPNESDAYCQKHYKAGLPKG